MQITDVQIKLHDGEGQLIAFANVVFDDEFVIHAKIIDTEKGLLLAMPQFRRRTGEWQDSAHPITQDMRRRLEDAVFAAHEEVQSGAQK